MIGNAFICKYARMHQTNFSYSTVLTLRSLINASSFGFTCAVHSITCVRFDDDSLIIELIHISITRVYRYSQECKRQSEARNG